MKKLYKIEEAIYTPKPKNVKIKNVETLDEHLVEESPVDKINEMWDHVVSDINDIQEIMTEIHISVLTDQFKLDENSNKMDVIVRKKEFKSLFGPKAKPRKGDILSITNKKFKVKKSKKFSAKKKGNGYKLSIKSA